MRNVRPVVLILCGLCLMACVLPTPSPAPVATETVSPSPTAHPTAPPASPVPTVGPTSSPPTPDFARALRADFTADLSAQADAPRYTLDLTLTLDPPTIRGRERVRYTNTEDVALEALYLRLFPNTPSYGGTMTVTAVSLDGRSVDPVAALDGSALRLPLAPPLAPGASVDLRLDFTLALPTTDAAGYRQLGYYDGVVALANSYPLVPVYDDERWNVELAPPHGDAVTSDVAFYDVRVTAPTTMTLAASGVCTASSPQAGRSTWSCLAAPMRDFNLVLGSDYQTISAYVDGVRVNAIFRPGHADTGARALDYAAESVRLFNRQFGPYPFTELDVVETPTLAGGIEYPGLVVINSAYYEDPGSRLEWIVVHEVAHQWWYSIVGNDQVDEPWLDEALTQYSTLLYYEYRYGADVADELVRTTFRRSYEEARERGRDQPAGLPVAAYDGANYGTIVYRKGPLYFHELRQTVGDETFRELLQAYFERYRHRIAASEDWLAVVGTVTGDQHRQLYDRWIGDVAE